MTWPRSHGAREAIGDTYGRGTYQDDPAISDRRPRLRRRGTEGVRALTSLDFVTSLGIAATELARGAEQALRIAALEADVRWLREEFAALRQPWLGLRGPLTLIIHETEPGGIRFQIPVEVVIQAEGDSYVATYFAAQVSASGDTQEEARDNLLDLLTLFWDDLSAQPDDRLGPLPLRQKRALAAIFGSE